MQPAITVNSISGGAGIIEIVFHHTITARTDFADFLQRGRFASIRIDNADLSLRQGLTHRRDPVGMRPADRVTAVVESKFATVQGLPRAGQTVDVAYAAVFLASDRGSFITGHDLVVDGGMVPFGTLGWKESIAMRAELARRIGAEVGQNA
jgi:NAD(P)-dependent dehydrogenase (short-subunit alcohol dehydrogenase family)